MVTNIFLCHTEYHLLMAINVSSELFGDKTYRNVIYIIYNKTRLKERANYDTSSVGNIEYRCITNEIADNIKFVKEISIECTGTLFLYNLYHPTELYIAYRIWEKGTAKCSFCQEGCATYISNTYNVKNHISTIVKVIKALVSARIFDVTYLVYLCFRRPHKICAESLDYRTAINSKTIESVYVMHPDLITGIKKRIDKIPQLSDTGLSISFQFFNYKHELSIKHGDILFIDQSVNDSNVSVFLNELHIRMPESKIYIKMHPLSSLELMNSYCRNLPSVKIFKDENPCPVELLISSLEGIRIISSYSSALLTINDKCSFYYIYPYLQLKGTKLNLPDFIPAKHIKLVNQIDDIC